MAKPADLLQGTLDMLIDEAQADLRYALRQLRQAPAFTAVAVLSLALSIGANTAIFSLINTLMLRPLPVREPGQLVELLNANYPGDPRHSTFQWQYYERYRDANHVFAELIAVSPARFRLSRGGPDAEVVEGEYVAGNVFAALGLQASAGRLIDPHDDRLDAANAAVAVLSWPSWQRRFNGDPAVVDTHIALDGVQTTIVGVAPRGFVGLRLGAAPEFWVPTAMEALIERPSHRLDGTMMMGLLARLRPGVSIGEAQSEMRVLDRSRVEETATRTNDPLWRQLRLDLEPAASGFSQLRERFARPLLVLIAAAGLLLLIACTNIAGMLLARGAARQREMAVRVALGAGRWRIARQVLTESFVLAAAGGVLGVVLARFGADALVRIIASGRHGSGLPQPLDLHVPLDLNVLLFTAGVAVLTGLLFGLAPAWHVFVSVPASVLRDMSAGNRMGSARQFGKALVVAQLAASVVLLSAAVLLGGHLSRLRSADLGFQSDAVLLVTLDAARSGYPRLQLFDLYKHLLARLETLPGVRAATLSGTTPISGAAASRFVAVEGFNENADARRRVRLNSVAPRYFETFGTPLLEGRDFTFEDQGRPRVAIVNQATARYYFGNERALGKRFTFEGQAQPYEIVGVVSDAKYSNLRKAAPRTIYLHAFQDDRGTSSQFALKTAVQPAALGGAVRRAVHDELGTIAVTRVITLADQMDASLVPERLMALMASSVAVLGALLAAVGLYGLLAYTVARRTHEIGVRMALGATGRDITGMVLKSVIGLVAAGLLTGAPVAVWSRRVAASLVEQLPVSTVLPIAVAAATMVAVALLAACVPARRASRVRPMEALRHS